MNQKILAVAAMLCMSVSQASWARETGWLNVTQVGGQVNTMFFDLSETVGDDLGCPGTRVLIPGGRLDADMQKRFYAALLTAMTTGKKLRLAVSGCTGNYPSMISTDYWFLKAD